MIDATRRAQLAQAGRIGGFTTAARIDTHARAVGGQHKFRTGFLLWHSCKVCPQTSIPTDLPDPERERRSTALYRAHMARIRLA